MLRAIANTAFGFKYAGSFTYATLPSAAAYSGYEAYATDVGPNGAKVRSNGTRWLPVNGRAPLATLMSDITLAATTGESQGIQALIPAGLLKAADTLELIGYGAKSGGTDTYRMGLRWGTTGVIANDTAVIANTVQAMNTAGVSGEVGYALQIVSNVSVRRISGVANGSGPHNSNSATATATAVAALADSDANQIYATLTFQGGATVDTTTLFAGAQIVWRTP